MGTRLIGLGGILLAGASVTVAVTSNTGPFDDNTDRDATGGIVDAGGLGAFRVEIGDCVNLARDANTIDGFEDGIVSAVEGIPCDDHHDAQAYAAFDITDLTQYSMSAVERRVEDGCISRWASAIGTDFWTDPELNVRFFFPSAPSWQMLDDREVVCFVTSLDSSPLVGSRLVEDRG